MMHVKNRNNNLSRIISELDDDHCRLVLVQFHGIAKPPDPKLSYRDDLTNELNYAQANEGIDPEHFARLATCIYYVLGVYQTQRRKAGLPHIVIE